MKNIDIADLLLASLLGMVIMSSQACAQQRVTVPADTVAIVFIKNNNQLEVFDPKIESSAKKCALISPDLLKRATKGEQIDLEYIARLNKDRAANQQLPFCSGLIRTSVLDFSSLSFLQSTKSPPCWHIEYVAGKVAWAVPDGCLK